MQQVHSYDKNCYLCPGNTRMDGTVNPDFKDAFVFTNDFSSLLVDTPEGRMDVNGLLIAKSVKGLCRVIIYSPDHSLTLPLLSNDRIKKLIDLWCIEFNNIASDTSIKNIQIFENKGEIMGCSNPHPHGQIWSENSIPLEIIKETKSQLDYFVTNGNSLLSDYIKLELEQKERIVLENEHFVALVPFWATWPYETLVVSKRHVQYLHQLSDEERLAFASILKLLTIKYDNLFGVSFPYSSGIHQAPVNNGDHPEWHLHMHFYPPLLRSATIKKFMVGYEMLANPQRDITPEWAADKLRNMSNVHYLNVSMAN
jgi:UDPglucose--hexose-1-phosphate uridylyltransferase